MPSAFAAAATGRPCQPGRAAHVSHGSCAHGLLPGLCPLSMAASPDAQTVLGAEAEAAGCSPHPELLGELPGRGGATSSGRRPGEEAQQSRRMTAAALSRAGTQPEAEVGAAALWLGGQPRLLCTPKRATWAMSSDNRRTAAVPKVPCLLYKGTTTRSRKAD